MDTTITLRTGSRVPRVGLGVFRAAAGAATRGAVLAALGAGYRHLDTAAIYRNERDVGEALRQSGVPRAEVFVTT
jgi:diketogulonate reductase-like aldo/keto reductase